MLEKKEISKVTIDGFISAIDTFNQEREEINNEFIKLWEILNNIEKTAQTIEQKKLGSLALRENFSILLNDEEEAETTLENIKNIDTYNMKTDVVKKWKQYTNREVNETYRLWAQKLRKVSQEQIKKIITKFISDIEERLVMMQKDKETKQKMLISTNNIIDNFQYNAYQQLTNISHSLIRLNIEQTTPQDKKIKEIGEKILNDEKNLIIKIGKHYREIL